MKLLSIFGSLTSRSGGLWPHVGLPAFGRWHVRGLPCGHRPPSHVRPQAAGPTFGQRPTLRLPAAAYILLVSCGTSPAARPPAGAPDAGTRGDPFADRVVSFAPGEHAGFGQDRMPGVVLGPPRGGGDAAGSTDVVSLGREGVIVLAFEDVEAVDGPGPDLIVFENPFRGYVETGIIAASADGAEWHEFPCNPADSEHAYPGCAGVRPAFASPGNGVDATDPATAGGDAFDLADVGLPAARFVRVRDSGANAYAGNSGGFDLDAVAVVHGRDVPK